MQTVLFTQVFERQSKQVGLTEEELSEIGAFLSANPTAGDLIVGTGGARKVRFASHGKGKSGGYRTIHYFGGEDVPIFVLALVAKKERADLTQKERNELARILPTLAESYRRAAKAKVREMKR